MAQRGMWARVGVGVAVAVALLTMQGCGGGANGRSTVAPKAAGWSLKTIECLARDGVGVDGNGGLAATKELSAARFASVLQSCGVKARYGVSLAASEADRNAVVALGRLRSIAACLRRSGFEIPPPNPADPGPLLNLGHVDRASPRFRASFHTCRVKR
jgi:hypothetical protein